MWEEPKMAELPPLETNTPCLEVLRGAGSPPGACNSSVSVHVLVQRRLTFKRAPAEPDAKRSAPLGPGVESLGCHLLRQRASLLILLVKNVRT